jgi:hypothetical protein
MPYLNHYLIESKKSGNQYFTLYWDRLNEMKEDKNTIIYKDSKKQYRKNIFEYLKYSLFIKRKIKYLKPDKIIVFGLPLLYFLRFYLKRRFSKKYIIDIRDYHKIKKMFSCKAVIKKSYATVISSRGFESWLPKYNYIVSHNSSLFDKFNFTDYYFSKNIDHRVNISYIGTIRDPEINIQLLLCTKDNEDITNIFHGFGPGVQIIQHFSNENNIRNVEFHGRYDNNQADKLYLESDIVNALIPNSSINSLTLLPNRLYNAALFCKPVLCLEGTYLSKIVKEFGLGIVIDNFESVGQKVKKFLKTIDIEKFERKRYEFILNVVNENTQYNECLTHFLSE